MSSINGAGGANFPITIGAPTVSSSTGNSAPSGRFQGIKVAVSNATKSEFSSMLSGMSTAGKPLADRVISSNNIGN